MNIRTGVRRCQQAAVQDQDVQEADRGGGGDHRPHLGQVQGGSAGAGGGQQAAVQEGAGQQGGAREGAGQLLP